MQEKINDKSKINTRRHSTKEERQGHVDNWRKSGLTMSEYCRQHNLAIANLSDWKRAFFKDSSQFKSISLLSPQEKASASSLIEVIVDQRVKIRFQCISEASLIVSIVKGLLVCS